MAGDYSVIIYWRTREGEERKVQTSASGFEKTSSQIESWGGTIYKVTRVGGGAVTPPSKGEPAKAEDKTIWEDTGVISGPGYAVHPSYGSREKVSMFVAQQEYKRTGLIPAYFKTEVELPRGLRSIGVKEHEYERIIYEHSLGLITEKQAEIRLTELTNIALRRGPVEPDIRYLKIYGRFGEGELTWEQIKKQEPALELKRESSGEWAVEPDYLKWQEQRHKDVGEGMAWFTGGISYFLSHYANLEAIYHTWTTPIGTESKRSKEITALWEYEATQSVEKRDWGKLGMQFATIPMLTHVVYPYIGGMVLKPVLGAVGIYGSEVVGGTAGKAISKGVPIGLGIIVGTAVGVDIVQTAVSGKEEELASKIATYGMQFTMFGLGAKYSPWTGRQIFEAGVGIKHAAGDVAYKVPGVGRFLSEVESFKAVGKYGGLQRGVQPPSALYLSIRERFAGFRDVLETYKGGHQFLKQQQLMRKFAFEHPVSMEQRGRFELIGSQYTATGTIRTKPRVGYALPYSTIGELAPTKGYLSKPFIESPLIREYGEIIFTKKVPTEGGYYLEYTQKSKIGIKHRVGDLPYEYEQMKGTGRIFKPDLPGEYKIAGKKIHIGEMEAYDVFMGRKVLLRSGYGRIERMGIPESVYAEAKLHIPSGFKIYGYLERPFTPGLSDFEQIALTKHIRNINQEYYKFFSFTKQTSVKLETTVTPGLGRTQKFADVYGYFKGHKMEISRYWTYGEYAHVMDPIWAKGIRPLSIQTGAVKGRGMIYDLTEWFGSTKPESTMPSKHWLMFEQLKQAPLMHISVSESYLKSISSYIPGGRQLPSPTTTPGLSTATRYAGPVAVGKSLRMFIPISITAQYPEIKSTYKTRSIEKSVTRFETKSISRLAEETIVRPMLRLEEKTVSRTETKQVSKLEEKSLTKLMEKQATKLMEKQIQKASLKSVIKPIARFETSKVIPSITPTTVTTTVTVPPPPLLLGFDMPSTDNLLIPWGEIKKKGARKRTHPVELLYVELFE